MGIRDRKEREKEQRRQLILLAAKKVVGNKGFRKTTVEDIAHEAEVSPGTIYIYFKNKEELYSSLALRVLQYLNMRMNDVIAVHKKSDLENTISAMHEAMLDVYRFDPLIIVNMFRLLSPENLKCLSPMVLKQVKDLFNSMLKKLNVLFAYNNGDRHLPLKSNGMADIFFTLFSGLSVWSDISDLLFEDKESETDSFFGTFELAVDLFSQAMYNKSITMEKNARCH